MADKKKNLTDFEKYVPPTDEFLEEFSRTEKLDKAVIDYTLDLIEESKKVNAAEKHKLTEEITRLYAVIKNNWQPQI